MRRADALIYISMGVNFSSSLNILLSIVENAHKTSNSELINLSSGMNIELIDSLIGILRFSSWTILPNVIEGAEKPEFPKLMRYDPVM